MWSSGLGGKRRKALTTVVRAKEERERNRYCPPPNQEKSIWGGGRTMAFGLCFLEDNLFKNTLGRKIAFFSICCCQRTVCLFVSLLVLLLCVCVCA